MVRPSLIALDNLIFRFPNFFLCNIQMLFIILRKAVRDKILIGMKNEMKMGRKNVADACSGEMWWTGAAEKGGGRV